MKIGTAIKMIREFAGLKVIDFNDCVSPSYLSEIEHEKKDPSVATFNSIARKLNIPVSTLFELAIAIGLKDDVANANARERAVKAAIKEYIRS